MASFIETTGNVLDVLKTVDRTHILIHCCNCHNNFGAGIARNIKLQYPEAYAADCETKKGDPSKLGTFTHATSEDGLAQVYNVYGQYWWRNSDAAPPLLLDKLVEGLKKVALSIDHHHPNAPIFTYRIGCNRAGGDWDVVKPILQEIFAERDVTIFQLPQR